MTLKGISERYRRILTELHRNMAAPFTASDAARALELDVPSARRLVAYLASRGWLTRVRRGLYATVPLEARQPEEWRQDPWVVATKMFEPLYIGGWSACEHWDLTEQLFRATVVVTARKLRYRSIEVQGFLFLLKSVRPDKLFGTRSAWRGQVRIPVSDPTRTVVDILDDPRIGGGIRHVAEVLRTYLQDGHRNDDLLLEYIDRVGNRAVYKRLGYLLESMGLESARLSATCESRISKGISLLDPSLEPRGKVLTRWNLRLNATVDIGVAG